MTVAPSPFAPAAFPDLPTVAGVRFSAIAAGIRYRNRDDLLLAELAEGTTVGGIFTRSQTAAAPVLWCRKALASGRVRGLVVNAGNRDTIWKWIERERKGFVVDITDMSEDYAMIAMQGGA